MKLLPIPLKVLSSTLTPPEPNARFLFFRGTGARRRRFESLNKGSPYSRFLIRWFRHFLRLLVFFLAYMAQGWDANSFKDPCPPGYEIEIQPGVWLDCETYNQGGDSSESLSKVE